jgi:hypothetical protein
METSKEYGVEDPVAFIVLPCARDHGHGAVLFARTWAWSSWDEGKARALLEELLAPPPALAAACRRC